MSKTASVILSFVGGAFLMICTAVARNPTPPAFDPPPILRLGINDTKTHYLLWALTEAIEPANLQKAHDQNFDGAVKAILVDFEMLSGKATPSAQ
jgi:hypothetical protein